MTITLVLTLLISLQYAVLVGIGISMILYIARQSNQIKTRRMEFDDRLRIREVEPPKEVPANEVLIIQPYGSPFFAAAPLFEEQLPTVTEESVNSVVIVRLRGKADVGSTLIDVLRRYAESLEEVDSKLLIVTDSDRIRAQLDATGAAGVIGEDNIYSSTAWLGETVRQAADDAEQWIADRSDADESDT